MPRKTLLCCASTLALLLVTGCQEREAQAPAQPVAQAQRQSEQALEQAQEAQEQARDQRQDLTGAREEAAEARQELAEARQQVQQESQAALEAQRQAEQQAQQASQQAQQAQQELAQRQEQLAQPGMGANQGGAMVVITGQVVAAREDSLTLRSPKGESVQLRLNEDTRVFVDGQQSELGNIPAGSEVRASYQPTGEQQPTALRVDITSQAHGGSGDTQQQQQQH